MKISMRLVIAGMGFTTLVHAGEVTLSFSYDPRGVSYETRGAYEKVTLSNAVLPEDAPGTPWLPAQFIHVLIPSGALVTDIRAEGDEIQLRKDISVQPAQPPQKRSGPRNAPIPALASAYASPERVPASLAAPAGKHTLRGYSLVSVRLNPIRYLPATKELFLVPQLRLTVAYAEPKARLSAPAAQRAEAATWVRELVVNAQAVDAFAPAAAHNLRADTTAQYLVITRRSCTNAFNALVQHRASRFNGQLLTVESITNTYTGTDAQAKIRACIQDYYQNHGTLYVVLGGDDTLVPDRDTKVSVDSDVESAMPTDLYYSGLDGTWNANGNSAYGEVTDNADLGWEVIVGRIPVQTAAQASNYVNKLIAFETAPPTHLAKKIILGGMLAWDTYTGTGRPSDDVTADGHLGFRDTAHSTVSDSEMWDRRLYRDGIRPYWQASTIGIFCDTLTSWDTSTGGDYLENATNVRKRFNEGWWHLYFSGHGDVTAWGLESGAFCSSDATALTNKTPFVYTDACLTGHFDGSTDPCLSEAFLRNPTGGALLYIGCSRYGWGEPDETPASATSDGGPSTVYGYKFYKRLYETTNRTAGMAFAMHKADMASQCSANGSERWIQFGLNLQGDPAILPIPSTQSPQTPPLLAAIGSQSTALSNALSFVVSAAPTDGDAITNLWATGLPSGATFTKGANNTNGTFSWPAPSPTGTYSAVFSAGDNDGSSSISVSIRVTNSTPVAGPAVIRAQGFEGATADNWTYAATAGSGTIATSTERAMSGTQSLKMTGSNKLNSDPRVEFDNVSLAGFTDVQLAIAFSASGPDSDDDLWLDLSYDNGATWTGTGSVKLVDGYGGTSLAFGATKASNPTTVAANPWTVAIPAGTAQLKVRIRYDEKIASANLSDHYYIDDLRLTGNSGGATPQTPPILAAIGNRSVQISNTLSFVVTAAATDGDAITNLWATGLPSGATFVKAANNASGTFTWASAKPAGSTSVTFWAGDNDGVDSEIISIAVTNPPSGGGGATTLKAQGFEGAVDDNWTYSASAGSGTIVVSSDRYMAGTKSLRLSGSSAGASDPSVVFDNVSLAGCSNVAVSVAFSADGPDGSDDLWLDLSFDNGATWPQTNRLVAGYSNAKILFGATNALNPTTVGANPWTVAIPAGTAQLKVRIRYDEKSGAANTADHYYIDRVMLTATSSGGPLGSPPILAAIGNKSVPVSNTLSFVVSVAATDGDAITNLWATGLPSGATFTPVADKTSGTFSWASAKPAGSTSVTFWTGDKDGTAHETISITVVPASSGSGALKFQGFEGATNDTWPYATAPGAGSVAASTNRCMSGAKSLKLSGSSTGSADPSATFANTSLAGQTGVQLSLAFSADGPDTDDDLYLDLSYDNGATWSGAGSCKLVDGYGNAKIAFGATVTTNPMTVASNPWIVDIPTSATQIQVRVRFDEKSGSANTSDHYYIDDVRLTSGGGARALLLEPRPLAEDDPQIAIVDPGSDSFTVPNATTEIALIGTCNEYATGWLTWSNDAAEASGAVLAGTDWSIPSIPLAIGENVVSIVATNAAGVTATAAATILRREAEESSGAAVLAFQGFEESAGDTWSYDLGAGTAMTSDRARTWLHSLVLAGSAAANADPSVTFDNIDLSRYDNVQVRLAFSAQGPDSGDDLWLDLSYDHGATWNEADSIQLVGGFRGLNLAFDATSSMSVSPNPYTADIPSGAEQVQIRIRYDEGAESDNTADFYFIDDLQIVAEEISGSDDDGDGLEDSWEESYFGSIVGVETDGNPDNDVLSNNEEFILDRNPNDELNPDSPFAVESIDPAALRFPASTRRCYTLQYTDDVTAQPQVWTDVPAARNRRGTNETMSLPLEDAPSARIYRVKVTLP